jgi:hypothetical protein
MLRISSGFALLVMSVGVLLGCQSSHSSVSNETKAAVCSAEELEALINKEAEEMKTSVKDEYDSDIIFKYAQQFDTCNIAFDVEEPFAFPGAEGRRPFRTFPVRLTLIKRRTETGATQTCVTRVQLGGDRRPKAICRTN